MTEPSCLPTGERTDDGPALAARTRVVARRGGAAGDTRCRVTEVTRPPRRLPAARTRKGAAASCPLAANTSMTSAKGDKISSSVISLDS